MIGLIPFGGPLLAGDATGSGESAPDAAEPYELPGDVNASLTYGSDGISRDGDDGLESITISRLV